MRFRLIIPLRASVLWSVLIPIAGAFGIIVASWVVPAILALDRDGLRGLKDIPVDWYGTAHAPLWVDHESDVWTRNLVDKAGALLTIPFVLAFGLLAERLWQVIGLRFGWMTEAQLDQFKKQRQLF